MSLEKKLLGLIRKVTKQDGATDISARVLRVDGPTAWVHIDGGVDETPVERTINCSTGDIVRVRLSGGQAYIIGNNSAPPTDDTTAILARGTANTAKILADTAKSIAGDAQESANAAASAADQAISDAAAAATAAGNAQSSANAAANAAAEADGKAVEAGNAASAAQSSATAAQASADNAGEYASRALGNLSTVQSVAETLNWITQHGTMTLTTDTALDPTHVYFVVDTNGDYIVGGTHYSVVTEPDVADIGTYYELSIDESLNNYVATHLAIDSEGLWIIPDANGFKVLIATGVGTTYTTAGTYIIDGNWNTVGEFTTNAITLGSRASESVVGTGSVVLGTSCEASGSTSVAGGFYNRASGNRSFAFGSNNIARGFAAFAAGDGVVAEGSAAFASGFNTRARGYASFTAGYNAIAENSYQTAVGKYNDNKTDTLLEVGNGTADNSRSNAFEVFVDGQFGTPGLWFSVNASGEPCVTFEDGN